MLACEKPFVVGTRAFGCGRCVPCLKRRRQIWSHRLQLEAYCHAENAFATLTYAEEELPKTQDGLPTLSPGHLRNFLKRLRKSRAPNRVRFFGVGEYGSETERPHYHVMLFGHPTCLRHQTDLTNPVCCSVCSDVQKIWNFGSVHLARVEPRSIQYVCGYVLKKMTSREDLRLGGRAPEFARMSLKPGIGALAIGNVVSAMTPTHLAAVDVPQTLDHGGRGKPLGRYLTQTIRKELGRDHRAPFDPTKNNEVLNLLESTFNDPGVSLSQAVARQAEGKIRQIHWALDNLGKKRGKL